MLITTFLAIMLISIIILLFIGSLIEIPFKNVLITMCAICFISIALVGITVDYGREETYTYEIEDMSFVVGTGKNIVADITYIDEDNQLQAATVSKINYNKNNHNQLIITKKSFLFLYSVKEQLYLDMNYFNKIS